MQQKIGMRIQEVIGEILEDYGGGRPIDKLDVFSQPNHKIIVDVTQKLFRVVFPGFFKDPSYRIYDVKKNISLVIEDIAFLLNREIDKVLRYHPDYSDACIDSETITLNFLERIPKVRAAINTDVEATLDGDPAAFNEDEIIYSYPGLYAIVTHRLAHELLLLKVPVIPRIMSEYAHSRTGIDIHPGASIGNYFFIDHGTGIVIGETTVIGCHVKIYQGVTLGALSTQGGRSLRNEKRHPTIEDHVTIYSGASILGGNTVIGRGAIIGGNAFITRSVAPCTTIRVQNQELKYDENKACVQKQEFEGNEADL